MIVRPWELLCLIWICCHLSRVRGDEEQPPLPILNNGTEHNHTHHHSHNHEHAHHKHARDINSTGKIAFMFLSRGDLSQEEVWHAFFDWHAPIEQYNIYWHTQPTYRPANTSFFYGKQIKNMVPTRWGDFTLVEAFRQLLKEALEDPLNEYFCLMSESCIPLVSFTRWRNELFGQNKSIINACFYNPGEMERDTRWNKGLDEVGFPRSAWRKSGQWVALNRKHAAIIANDTLLAKGFANVRPVDEHYAGSVLANHGLDNETTCSDGFVHVYWPNDIASHPLSHPASDINGAAFFHRLMHSSSPHGVFNARCSGLPHYCHLTARKFPGGTTYSLLTQLQHVLSDEYHGNYTMNSLRYHWQRHLLYSQVNQKLYYLDAHNAQLLHEIPDARYMGMTAAKLNNSYIQQEADLAAYLPMLAASEEQRYSIGSVYDLLQDHLLLKLHKDNTIWLTIDGYRRLFPNFVTFVKMGFDTSQVKTISAEDMEKIRPGPWLPEIANRRIKIRA